MKHFFITGIFALSFFFTGFCQKEKKTETLSPEQSKEILSKLNIDTAKLLGEFSVNACKCIDSITLSGKGSKEISEDIFKCIDEQVGAYQLSLKIYQSMKSGNADKITLDTDKKSNEYKRYYFDIERWLKDSCESLNNAVASNNKESAFSMSGNPKAMEDYNAGVVELKAGDFKKAAGFFAKAVKTDRNFAFAWDNLGICHRRLGNLDEALEAYNKSLKLDPKGVTPLHNIPVVYEFQKKYDQAIEAYQNILRFYPDDPEAFYGEGRIYIFFKIDLEKGLQYMCKAYNIYTSINSPYRVDAEKNINYIYGKMKADGTEKRFFEILKENNINAGNN
jgi:tetratricopeptide (TPR) repeat protein